MNEQAGAFDINEWYMRWEICPNCGLNLRTCGPATNLFPHFMGGCKKAPVTAAEAKEE